MERVVSCAGGRRKFLFQCLKLGVQVTLERSQYLRQTLQFGEKEKNMRSGDRPVSYKCGEICVCTNETGRKKRSWHAKKEGLMPSRIKVIAGEMKNVMDGR